MNGGVIIGIFMFVIWGAVSSWWYVCKINNLCDEDTGYEVVDEVIEDNTPIVSLSETVPSAEIKPIPIKPINLSYNDILFAKNSKDVIDKEYVVKIIKVIQDTAQSGKVSILITGHACDLGSSTYNQSLGLQRAENVRVFLLTELDAEVNVQSRGEDAPLNQNANERERVRNRRVEIEINIKNND